MSPGDPPTSSSAAPLWAPQGWERGVSSLSAAPRGFGERLLLWAAKQKPVPGPSVLPVTLRVFLLRACHSTCHPLGKDRDSKRNWIQAFHMQRWRVLEESCRGKGTVLDRRQE